MYIYKWESGLNASKGDNLIINETAKLTCNDFSYNGKNFSIKGIDKIRNESDLGGIKNCVEFATNNITKDRHNRAYIYLAATAGMRLLEYYLIFKYKILDT
jgi:Golgi nucleoside diphosphatase